jgi:glycogen phosphorylase
LFYDAGHGGVPNGWVEMIRHTLRGLGPKVRAERMVQDYVTALYGPAASASRVLAAEDYAGARQLAVWKARVREAWPDVRIEHVEADAGEPNLGSALHVRVTVVLGTLTRDDVLVEVACGRPGDDDEITSPQFAELTPDDAPAAAGAGDPVRFSGSVELGQPGPFGYTVRILPRHQLLASRAEMGLVTYPDAPAGMTNGDLR